MSFKNSLILFFATFLTTSLLYAQNDTVTTKKPVVCTVTKSYNVGDMGPANGWIIYKKPVVSGQSEDTCWQYLEAAPVDSQASVWSNITDVYIGTTSTGIGAGMDNTKKIIAQPNHTTSAAQICDGLIIKVDDKSLKGWFLPSKDELALMYKLLKKKNIGDFSSETYWSSSESNEKRAWFQYFSNGNNNLALGKNLSFSVRCVRAF